jgi:DNA repair protein RadC
MTATQPVPAEHPHAQRRRERIFAEGAAALATADLFALLVGAAAAGRPDEAAAAELIGGPGGLRTLAARTACELAELPWLGEESAARLAAAIEIGRRLATEPLQRGEPLRGGSDVFRHYHARLRDLRVEQFLAVLLDGKHRVLREELISQGTLTSSPVHPREVFAPAIRHSAAALVLVHNHPSGDPSPSADDLEITNRLCEVGSLVGIRVLDHVIVGDGAFVSLADRGLMSR